MDNGGSQRYLLADGLGSTRGLTDGTGTLTASYAYDVFGALRSATGTDATAYRFTGQQEEAALGAYYLRARSYDPSTGRFFSKDPFPGFLTNPASQHPYSYVQNNPANLVDPSGELAVLPVLAVAWAAFEIGSTIYDAYTTVNTLRDPCASTWEKVGTTGLFAARLFAPGSGYTSGAKRVRPLLSSALGTPRNSSSFITNQWGFPGCHEAWRFRAPNGSASASDLGCKRLGMTK
jgi:RHS repeat-associated protein